MADVYNTSKVNLLHPFTTLHRERCHTWINCEPLQCIILGDRVAILTWRAGHNNDILHISSTDLHSWITATLPHKWMSLATYKSQFVAVGGYDLSTKNPIDLVFTSNTGLEWQPSLPCMITKRWFTSSVGTISPDVLVVAGGDNGVRNINNVEVLLENKWHSVDSLPKPCRALTSTVHQGEIVFTDRNSSSIYSCRIDSLVSSGMNTSIHSSLWKFRKAPRRHTTTVFYSSYQVNIDGYGVIRGYSPMSASWVEISCVGVFMMHSMYTSAITLPSGDIFVAHYDGVYRIKVARSSFDPDVNFGSDVVSRLEVVMGIEIAPVLANRHSQLTVSSGVKLQTQYNMQGQKISLPDPQKDPSLYVEEFFFQWSAEFGSSHRPPTWGQLLDILQDIGLIELSQQIEGFLKGNDEYIDAYHHFISTKDILEMLFLKFLFLGPSRQGKTTARRRLLGEIDDLESAGEADQHHASTGTVECGHDMIVQGLTDTTAVITGRRWSAVQSLTDEARLLFHSFVDRVKSQTDSLHASASSLPTKSVGETIDTAVSSVSSSSPLFSDPEPEVSGQNFSVRGLQSNPDQNMAKQTYVSEISAVFRELTENFELWKYVKDSFRAYLRMEDTGGQPELMDMLPALTIGPGFYLLFFSYEFQLDEAYQVFYQRASGEKTAPEKSSFTLKEMLLSTLSSISCSSASCHLQQLQKTNNSDMNAILESSKSLVHIVGTHKDKVSEEYIAKVDHQLQTIIKDTDFYKKGIVRYCSENKLVISLDNMRGGKEEVHQLHQLLEKAMERHFKKLKIPAVWLLFSLCLRIKGERTASMETCLELSKAFNMSSYETKVALWFLHHHAGVMMYFPSVSGLEELIIIDIQVVYDSITHVILEAMSFNSVGKAKSDRFRKTGQFSLEDISSATATISKGIIPPRKLVALLCYLHIIAQIRSENTSHDNSEYIMPCVLEYATSKELDLFHKEACKSCFVFPLYIYFICGFTPMGLFPAMIACLISNKSFNLVREGIQKNMVHFMFKSMLYVTFISRPKYYEIVISCQHISKNSLHLKCAALKSVIENVLREASSRMNYSNYKDYQFGFECSLHEEGGHLAVIDSADLVPENMTCLYNPDHPQLVVLENKHLLWYGQNYGDCTIFDGLKGQKPFSVFMSVYPQLVWSVKPCVKTVADHCISCGLISEEVYDQIISRRDLVAVDQARILLSNVRTVLSCTPHALKEFISVLLKVKECWIVAEQMKQQLTD